MALFVLIFCCKMLIQIDSFVQCAMYIYDICLPTYNDYIFIGAVLQHISCPPHVMIEVKVGLIKLRKTVFSCGVLRPLHYVPFYKTHKMVCEENSHILLNDNLPLARCMYVVKTWVNWVSCYSQLKISGFVAECFPL